MDGTTATEDLPTLAEVEQTLRASWTRDTSDDPDKWTPENAALGQCAVSALVIRALYGGEIVIATVLDRDRERTPDGHAWNVLPSGEEVDFTFDQFRDGEQLAPPIGTEPVIKIDGQMIARRPACHDDRSRIGGGAQDATVEVIDLMPVHDRASDVHIEPMEHRVRVRNRIDGALKEVLSLPSSSSAPAAAIAMSCPAAAVSPC